MQKKIRFNTTKIINTSEYIFYISLVIIVSFVFLQVFFFSTFKIPSDSMSPALESGDHVLVCKPILGARIFNIFASMRNEQTEIYRIPGLREIRRNDILVFNFPCPNNWDTVEMHILKYYIKRCIGLPGDSLIIDNGLFKIKGYIGLLGNSNSQRSVVGQEKECIEKGSYYTFPYDNKLMWNIKDFGPLYIPKAGDEIPMNPLNHLLYKKVIEWEQRTSLVEKDSVIYLNKVKIDTYQFKKSYYFVAGDNSIDSQDSRYWGLLPEEYIAGKAWLIWKSIDPYTNKLRFKRLFKAVD